MQEKKNQFDSGVRVNTVYSVHNVCVCVFPKNQLPLNLVITVVE